MPATTGNTIAIIVTTTLLAIPFWLIVTGFSR